MCKPALLLFAALAFAAVPVKAQEGGDLQVQIVYAFQVEDTNLLVNLVQTLATQANSGSADSALRYHLAHAQYRLGLLVGEKRAKDAATAFGECVDQLKRVLEQNPMSAEALALQSACYAGLAKYKSLEAVLLRSRSTERIGAALRLAPRNPRVLYLAAIDGFARSMPGSAEHARAFAELARAVQLFDQSSSTDVEAPSWGHAEAYLELGIQLQSRGDLLGARNSIEKALIAAPDFKAAQKQLANLARH
jgi:tetratricopeptide (TPR) repeat protein